MTPEALVRLAITLTGVSVVTIVGAAWKLSAVLARFDERLNAVLRDIAPIRNLEQRVTTLEARANALDC